MAETVKSTRLNGKYQVLDKNEFSHRSFANGIYQEVDGTLSSCIIVCEKKENISNYHQQYLSFAETLQLPDIIDLFSENDLSYLVIESVPGKDWSSAIHEVFNRTAWEELSSRRKGILLSFCKMVVSLYEKLEAANFSFIISPDAIVLADDKMIFRLLPADFMWTNETTFIYRKNRYNLALMIMHALTDLIPIKLDYQHPEVLREALFYFIADREIVDFITNNVSQEKENPYTFQNFNFALHEYTKRLMNKNWLKAAYFTLGSIHKASNQRDQLANAAINISGRNKDFANKHLKSSGTLEIPYFLNRVKPTIQHYQNWESNIDSTERAYLLLSGILTQDELNTFLSIQTVAPNFTDGLAAKYYATMQLMSSLAYQETIPNNSNTHLKQLLDLQLPDGSWANLNISEKLANTIFSSGIAGIAFVLWTHYERYGGDNVLEAAEKAMDWLKERAVLEDDLCFWLRNNGKKLLNFDFSTGVAGIAFSFIVAARITKREDYKSIAEKTLYALPERIHSNHFSYLKGLAGLGDVYLEAWYTFKKSIWKTRANAIFETLWHTRKTDNGGIIYWITEDEPDAGLLNGYTGIMFFLLRYLEEGETTNHLFNVPHE